MSGVFISYRRSDSAGHTGRLAADLSKALGEETLFRDLEDIGAGEDFVDALQRAVAQCSVMLVVIGQSWASAAAPDGKRRLFHDDDFVRMEIEAGLARDIRVIPLLVGEATMPSPSEVPESLQPLLRRNAFSISDRRWQYDIDQLIDIITRVPGIARKDAAASVASTAPVAPPATAKKAGIPAWMKIAGGALGGVLLLIVIAGLMNPSPTVSSPASATALQASPVEGTQPAPSTDSSSASDAASANSFLGTWRSGEGVYFEITTDKDNNVIVLSGTSLDADTNPTGRDPAAPGEELTGIAHVDASRLEAILTDTISHEVEKLNLMYVPDDSLKGTLESSDGQVASLLLRRTP